MVVSMRRYRRRKARGLKLNNFKEDRKYSVVGDVEVVYLEYGKTLEIGASAVVQGRVGKVRYVIIEGIAEGLVSVVIEGGGKQTASGTAFFGPSTVNRLYLPNDRNADNYDMRSDQAVLSLFCQSVKGQQGEGLQAVVKIFYNVYNQVTGAKAVKTVKKNAIKKDKN